MHSFVLNPDLLVVNKDNVVVVVVVVIAVALLTLLTLSFVPPGHVAAPAERAEIPLAKAQRLRRLLLPVQSDGHHRRVCPEGGATGRGEDEEMSPQTGDSGVCVCVSVCVSVFHLKPDPCYVCSVCAQLERAEVRLEGIDTMLKLASKNFLLPSVQYAMLCGWQRVVPEGTDNGSVSSLHRLRCYKKMKIYSSVPVPELAVGLHRTPPPSTAVALPPVLT